MIYGIDVSHHQAPASLPWRRIAERSSFCVCRASYGTMRDREMPNHVAKAREVGLDVGAYHFFRPSQDWKAQLAVFHAACEAAGYGVGDIVPVLDIEADPLPKPGIAVSTLWQGAVRSMLEALRAEFGGAIAYITQREFGMLGKPDWLLEYARWVAFYSNASKPATPANAPWLIWQHRVGEYDPDGPGGFFANVLDQNRAQDELPLVVSPPSVAPSITSVETFDNDDELEDLIALAFSQQFDVDEIVRRERNEELLEPENRHDTEPPETERNS